MREYTATDLMVMASKCDIASLDIEYDPADDWREKTLKELWGCGFSTLDESGNIIAIYMKDRETIQEVLDYLIMNDIPIVGHYFMSDICGFKGAGYTFQKDPIVRGTEIAYNLLNDEWQDRDLGLKKLAPKILGKERSSFEENAGYGKDSPEFEQYAKDDVIDQLDLYLRAAPQLKELELWDVYEIVCGSLVSFADMMFFGMPYDIDVAEDLFNKLCILKDELEEEVYKMIGKVNLASPKQLRQRLYSEMGYNHPKLKETDTGEISTGEHNMTLLAVKYPVCEAILAYRTCAKLISTYVEPCVEQALSYDGRIHALFWLTSATGRTRCSKPNIQNQPNALAKFIKHNQRLKEIFAQIKIRSAFRAPEGEKLIISDYKSLEYRTAAIAAPDQLLIAMYKAWKCNDCLLEGSDENVVKVCPECESTNFTQSKDLHIHNRDIANDAGADIDRSQAKAVSFLTIFNGGPRRLSQDLGISFGAAKNVLSRVLGEFKGLRDWHARTKRIVLSTGEVRCMFNRRRKINLQERLDKADPEDHNWIIKNCVNMLVNVVAQGPACMIGQVALSNVRKRLIKEGLYGQIKIVNFVHDEIILQAPDHLAEYALELLHHEMRTAVSIGVPLDTDGCIVQSWDLAK